MKSEQKHIRGEPESIPKGWRVIELSECTELVIDHRGQTPKKLGGVWISTGGFRALSAKNVKSGQIVDDDSIRQVDADLYRKWMPQEIKRGDILLTSEGPMGETMFWDSEEKVVLSQRLFGIRAKKEIVYPEYLYAYFCSDIFQRELQARATGTTVLGIRQSELLKTRVVLPPMNQQTVIGDLYHDSVRTLSNNRETSRCLLDISSAMFERWFVHFEFPNEEGKPYKSNGGEMVDSELGSIPKGWYVGDILDLADLMTGGTPRTKIAGYWGGGIPWVSARDVTNAHGSYILDTEKTITHSGVDHSNAKLLPKNTTVVTARGTVGSYCLLGREMAINQTNYGLKAKSGFGDFFVFHLVSNLVRQMKQKSYGTVFDTITSRTFDEMKIPLPPESLTKLFDGTVGVIMSRILNNLEESRTLTSIRDRLLPKLMSAEVTIRADKQMQGVT